MRLARIVPLLATLLVGGCVTSHPQSADEFRQAVPGAAFAKVEHYEVNRPYKEVSATFRKMAPKCLNISVKTVSQSRTSYQVIVTDYKPTVVVGKNRTEFHLQQHHAQGVMKVTKEPEGGYYLLVVDATPIDKRRTLIKSYGPSMGYKPLMKAVRGWATGENVGCPDMTK